MTLSLSIQVRNFGMFELIYTYMLNVFNLFWRTYSLNLSFIINSLVKI